MVTHVKNARRVFKRSRPRVPVPRWVYALAAVGAAACIKFLAGGLHL